MQKTYRGKLPDPDNRGYVRPEIGGKRFTVGHIERDSQGEMRRRRDAIRSLSAHSDVVPALERLQQDGHRLVTMTNSSKAVLAEQMRNSGLEKFFESMMSVEEIGLYKPHTHVYRWAARRVGADVSECLFVAAHGWDVAGAAWAGMQTAFVARPGKVMFPLGPKIDIVVPSFAELPEAIAALAVHK